MRDKYNTQTKKYFSYIKVNFKPLYKIMKKNSGEENTSLQVDAITGEYYIVIPEWMVNELSWYEDTEINIQLDGADIILSEQEES